MRRSRRLWVLQVLSHAERGSATDVVFEAMCLATEVANEGGHRPKGRSWPRERVCMTTHKHFVFSLFLLSSHTCVCSFCHRLTDASALTQVSQKTRQHNSYHTFPRIPLFQTTRKQALPTCNHDCANTFVLPSCVLVGINLHILRFCNLPPRSTLPCMGVFQCRQNRFLLCVACPTNPLPSTCFRLSFLIRKEVSSFPDRSCRPRCPSTRTSSRRHQQCWLIVRLSLQKLMFRPTFSAQIPWPIKSEHLPGLSPSPSRSA